MERMIHKILGGLLFSAVVLLVWDISGLVSAATLRSAEEVSRVVELRDVSSKDGDVSGVVVNKTDHTLRDVEIQIRYNWRWQNEFKPQEDNAGDTVVFKVKGDIPAGQTRAFSHKHALPSRPDGHYETSVSVAGYTDVIPQ